MANEQTILWAMDHLRQAGFSAALAIATEAEVAAGAACGQLSIIAETGK